MNSGHKMETQLKSGNRKAESGPGQASPFRLSPFQFRPAFTLTELLVVIAIIAILASLITAAAVNAMNASKRTAITLEIRQLGDAIERFKTNLGGAYPPNVLSNTDPTQNLSNSDKKLNAQNLVRFLTKARPQSTELATNMSVIPPQRNSNPAPGVDNVFPLYNLGIRPSEALVLWLSGFSGDPKRPFSGADLEVTAIDDNGTTASNVITFESFDAPLYEFDKTRLKYSREANGDRRVLAVYDTNGNQKYLQLYEYFPKGSEQPFLYFNTVDTPQTVARTWQSTEIFYENPKDPSQVIYPLKKMKANAPTTLPLPTPALQFVEYVNQGKYQIFHSGLDDAWGNFSNPPVLDAKLEPQDQDTVPTLLFPTGPFTGDMADTLSNFADGTLENEQK